MFRRFKQNFQILTFENTAVNKRWVQFGETYPIWNINYLHGKLFRKCFNAKVFLKLSITQRLSLKVKYGQGRHCKFICEKDETFNEWESNQKGRM